MVLVLVRGKRGAVGQALTSLAAQSAASAGATWAQAPAATFPKDVYANTGNRLPAVKREDLDDAGKKLFDSRGAADFFGPGGIRLYSPPVAEQMSGVNDFLRHKSGLDPRLVELAILVTAREEDCEYVLAAHEPQGVEFGLPPETIDIVRYRRSTCRLAEENA